MRYVRRAGFRNRSSVTDSFKKMLLKNNVIIDESLKESGSELCNFYIYTDDPLYPEVEKFINEYGSFSMLFTEFNNDEFNNAKWLTMRMVWYYIYYDKAVEAYYKENHKEMIGIRKEPNFGNNRHFTSLYSLDDELLISVHMSEMIGLQQFTGIEIRDVMNLTRKEISNNTKWLRITSKLPPAFSLDYNEIQEKIIHKESQKEDYILTGKELYLNHSAFEEVHNDVMLTSDYLNSRRGLIIVSQKFYRFIIENKLGRALIFEPIFLV